LLVVGSTISGGETLTLEVCLVMLLGSTFRMFSGMWSYKWSCGLQDIYSSIILESWMGAKTVMRARHSHQHEIHQ